MPAGRLDPLNEPYDPYGPGKEAAKADEDAAGDETDHIGEATRNLRTGDAWPGTDEA